MQYTHRVSKLFFTPEVNNIIHVETLWYAAQRMPTERYLEEHPNASIGGCRPRQAQAMPGLQFSTGRMMSY